MRGRERHAGDVARVEPHDIDVLLGVLLHHHGGGQAQGCRLRRALRGGPLACTSLEIWNSRRGVWCAASEFSRTTTRFQASLQARQRRMRNQEKAAYFRPRVHHNERLLQLHPGGPACNYGSASTTSWYSPCYIVLSARSTPVARALALPARQWVS